MKAASDNTYYPYMVKNNVITTNQKSFHFLCIYCSL